VTGGIGATGVVITGIMVTGLAACAGMPTASPGALAYEEPDPNPVTYSFADTTTFEIQAQGYGVLEVETGRQGSAELHFHGDGGGENLRVRVRFQRLDATFRDATRQTDAVTEADLDGPVDVGLSPTGRLVVVDTPAVTAAFLEVAGVEALVRPFFITLPGRPVEAGARWTDTVVTEELGPETTTRATSVIVATLVGDTVVAGRRLLRIETRTETAVEVTGESGGVAIEQQLAGTMAGIVLWDPHDRLLVSRAESGTLSGYLLMPGASPASLPVSTAIRRSVALGADAITDPEVRSGAPE
jgi:hypothetical protein